MKKISGMLRIRVTGSEALSLIDFLKYKIQFKTSQSLTNLLQNSSKLPTRILLRVLNRAFFLFTGDSASDAGACARHLRRPGRQQRQIFSRHCRGARGQSFRGAQRNLYIPILRVLTSE